MVGGYDVAKTNIKELFLFFSHFFFSFFLTRWGVMMSPKPTSKNWRASMACLSTSPPPSPRALSTGMSSYVPYVSSYVPYMSSYVPYVSSYVPYVSSYVPYMSSPPPSPRALSTGLAQPRPQAPTSKSQTQTLPKPKPYLNPKP